MSRTRLVGGSLEKSAPDVGFEPLKVAADSALSKPKRLGRSGETAGFRQNSEKLQRKDVDAVTGSRFTHKSNETMF